MGVRIEALSYFYSSIESDNRINARHISVYMAMFECWHKNGFENPVAVQRLSLMAMAKISGIATYHRCMKDLHAYGYIDYQPSFHPRIRSRVYILQP